jgi:hypothetical protein
MNDIQLILVDPNEAVCQAWAAAFKEFEEVAIVHGRLESLPEFDCLVSRTALAAGSRRDPPS